MPRLVPVNAEFDTDLSRLGTPAELAGLRHGIQAALAVAPGDVFNPTDYPLLGYYYTFDAEQFLAYFITPGRFVRYEVAGGRSLTVTVPTSRVSRVVEEAGANELMVTVELDADAVSGILEAQTESQQRPEAPGVQAGAARAMARLTRTVYELRAADAETMPRLAAFSRAARSAVGA